MITGPRRGGSARLEGGGAVRRAGLHPGGACRAARRCFCRATAASSTTHPWPRVIERLTGLALSADDLLLALAGCVGAGEASNGRQWSRRLAGGDTADGRTRVLRQQSGAWHAWPPSTAAAGASTIASSRTGWPRQVRLRSDGWPASISMAQRAAARDEHHASTTAAFDVAIPPGTEADDARRSPIRRAAPDAMTLVVSGFRQDQSRPAHSGCRPDGYHDLRTVFQSLALARHADVHARARARFR